ncbi:2985_t:CDS:2 [Paraglomus occultum]|uniref:2985_t:CDS:1 n=1 Tax=Paraglomus occultum TaxID=144539 RepID=A0A9N9CVB6_9GLOM|nr:2985_t:CDS:2 [Paraglomus occultum]
MVTDYLHKTDEEAEHIVTTILIQQLYNGYVFINELSTTNRPEALYNPQLVFHFLHEFASHGYVARPDEPSTVHSTHVLKTIANIGGGGAFTVDDLIELIIHGSIKSKIVNEFGFIDLLEIGAVRSMQSVNEAALQGIVELLLDDPASCMPELHLVLDGTKMAGSRFGFVDILFCQHQQQTSLSKLELSS